MKKPLRIFLYISCSALLVVLISRLEIVRVFLNDDILNICEDLVGNPESPQVNSFLEYPDKASQYAGVYELEFCAVHRGRDNSEYLVKLRDAKNKKIYKRGLGEIETQPVLWGPNYVSFGVGDRSYCFKLPPNTDPNSVKIEEKIKQSSEYYEGNDEGCL